MKAVLGIAIVAVVALVVGCAAPALSAAETAYRNALIDHHERMHEKALQGPGDDQSAEAYYTSMMYLALEGMDKNTKNRFLEQIRLQDPHEGKYLAPPANMAHIQEEYNQAMLRYTEGYLNYRRAVLFSKMSGEELVMSFLDGEDQVTWDIDPSENIDRSVRWGREAFESGDAHIARTQELMRKFVRHGV